MPKNSRKLNELRRAFQEWSGFKLEGETIENISEEIKSRQYQLECEVSEIGSQLLHKAEEIFNHLKIN